MDLHFKQSLSASNVEQESSSLVFDLFIKTLIKTFQTPISEREAKTKLSVNIMLENDVFNLDDALRLFIQQFIVALYDGRIHLLPDDWETRYPAYAKVINEINNVLDIIGQRTLSQISMKDVRPFIKGMPVNMLIYSFFNRPSFPFFISSDI